MQATVGPNGPLAKRKAFTRADIIRVVAPTLCGCPADELDCIVTGIVRHPECVPLVGQPGARGRAWAAASVLATEHAIEAVAERLVARDTRVSVDRRAATVAIAEKDAALGRRLTDAQRRVITEVVISRRGLDLVVGVAGSGKTTALDAIRAAYETSGHRVLGTATSGQAARTLRDEAAVDSRTIASLVWRLENQQVVLDERTVLLIDEASMADDVAMLKLLAAVDVAGAKAVVVGDHHQLDAVDPGGGLEALINRHGPAVHVLEDNVRQRDAGERAALEQLRAGSVTEAVAWYGANERLRTAPTRDEALDAAVEAWEADLTAGQETVLLAWRRRDVAALNERARQRMIATGRIEDPEGRRYARGDRVVTLAPGRDARFVTSERGTVTATTEDRLTVRFDDGRTEVLTGDELGRDRLDHAYAVTVHRMQGATVDRAHVFVDGGGRELAYVAMSRAGDTSLVHMVADDLDQAEDDLIAEWSTDGRQRWVLDLDEVATESQTRRPNLAHRTESSLRLARLRSERDAVQAVAPHAFDRLRILDSQLRLEQIEQRPAPPQAGLARA